MSITLAVGNGGYNLASDIKINLSQKQNLSFAIRIIRTLRTMLQADASFRLDEIRESKVKLTRSCKNVISDDRYYFNLRNFGGLDRQEHIITPTDSPYCHSQR